MATIIRTVHSLWKYVGQFNAKYDYLKGQANSIYHNCKIILNCLNGIKQNMSKFDLHIELYKGQLKSMYV